jgi:hypothetical protein
MMLPSQVRSISRGAPAGHSRDGARPSFVCGNPVPDPVEDIIMCYADDPARDAAAAASPACNARIGPNALSLARQLWEAQTCM